MPYRWWKTRSSDVRNAIIPIFLSLSSAYTLYRLSIYLSERDVYILEKAKVPEEFNPENLKKY